jgi:hypothetical protein
MKPQINKRNILLGLTFLVLVFSCRTEDDLSIDPDAAITLKANSTVANLMARVATLDGSEDNIIDKASCLKVQLPVTVTVNGLVRDINDKDDYGDIKNIIDLSNSDVDTIVISYPITVIFTDFTTMVVNSDSELTTLSLNCAGENEEDDDIECLDFIYPVTISYFNKKTEAINSIPINNDKEMYNFIEDLNTYAAATINFPVTILFADGITQTTANVDELEATIAQADNTCDEDDDIDFNDDCDSCSTNELQTLLVSCDEWEIERLKRNNNYLIEKEDDYEIEFFNDGTLTVEQDSNTYNGTWVTSGSGANITLILNITGLPEMNDSWNLQKIDKKKEHIEFRSGTAQLHFKGDC